MTTKILLIEDVDHVGRSGDIVSVKPGYARNFLLPRGVAVVADNRAIRQQAKLQEERAKRAAEDKKDSEALAKQFEGVVLTHRVKVDDEGHMYGSVSVLDIIKLLEDETKVNLEKKNIQLKEPIKKLGIHVISLKFKEDVEGEFTLKVISENESLEETPQPSEEKEQA